MWNVTISRAVMEKSILLDNLPDKSYGQVPLIVKQRLKNLTEIEEWGGYDDHRTPAEFVNQFFTAIAENMDSQEHIGQIFFAYVRKNCETWADAHRQWRNRPSKLVSEFLKDFWPDTRKAEELSALHQSEYNNNKYASVTEYINYWRRRLPLCNFIKSAVLLNILQVRVPLAFQSLFEGERGKEKPDFE